MTTEELENLPDAIEAQRVNTRDLERKLRLCVGQLRDIQRAVKDLSELLREVES